MTNKDQAAIHRMAAISYLNDVCERLCISILEISLFDESRAKRLATYERKIKLIQRDLLENESIAVCSND